MNTNEITRDGYRVTWTSDVNRWTKSESLDRLYFPKGYGFVNLAKLDDEFRASRSNPYGVNQIREGSKLEIYFRNTKIDATVIIEKL